MTWLSLAEKVIGYMFILAITYMCSQTLLQWNNDQQIKQIRDEVKEEQRAVAEELRKKYAEDVKLYTKEIIRLELQINEFTTTSKYRMDTIEKDINNKTRETPPL